MKKRKKYTRITPANTPTEEPIVAYEQSLLSQLAEIPYNQIVRADYPGSALIEIQHQTRLSMQDLAGIIGISKSKFYDLLQKERLDPKIIDALVDFAALWQKGVEAFEGRMDLLLEWLHTRNENLGNVKPVTLFVSRSGRRAVENSFLRIEYSIYG